MPITEDQIASRVKDQVLRGLGKPPQLYNVTACKVGERSFRVNIWTAKQSATEYNFHTSLQVQHSFFVKIDNDGNIAESMPELKSLY